MKMGRKQFADFTTGAVSRRRALQGFACGFGSLAFSAMASGASKPRFAGHHVARAKRVIFLFMHGGPSHVDTFDYKPELQKRDGERLPFAPAKNLDPTATRQAKLMGSPWAFRQYGESGLWISDLFPEVARMCSDDLCVVRSMQSRGQSHGQAVCMLHTGVDNFVRPSVGAWVSYGLGTENSDLPGFVSISPSAGHGGPRNLRVGLPPRRAPGDHGGPERKARDRSVLPLPGFESGTLAPAEQDRLP